MITTFVLTSPVFYDQSVLTLDFPGILFLGFLLKTIHHLIDDEKKSSRKCLFFLILMCHSCIHNGLYLAIMILYLLYFKIFYKVKTKLTKKVKRTNIVTHLQVTLYLIIMSSFFLTIVWAPKFGTHSFSEIRSLVKR